MGTEYTWLIWDMKRDPSTGSVGEVHFRVAAQKDGARAINAGSVTLVADPNSPSFIPYEQLTPEIVIAWVKEKLATSDRPPERIYEWLDERLAEKLGAATQSGVPWA